MTLYFEDLAVGDVFETGSYTFTKKKIVTFARQFDPQPFHVDEEAAADSMFGELVASGLHTLCVSVRLFIVDFVHGKEGVANMGGNGMDEIRFHEPVYPGDTLSVRIEVVGKKVSESHPESGTVDFRRTAYNDRGDEVMTNIGHDFVRRADEGM